MTKLLQDKNEQWRARPNGATPVFDPGLSALGTDDEAGGAHAPVAQTGRSESKPMSATPELPRHDPRLKPWVWWTGAGLLFAVFAMLAGVSFL